MDDGSSSHIEGARAPSRQNVLYGTDWAGSGRIGAAVTSLELAGFKSIRDKTVLQLKPLTVLAGHNAAGKSSFMQAFLLLKQTLQQDSTFGKLLLDGSHVSFDKYSELFWRGGNRNGVTFSLGFTAKSVHGTRECMQTYVKTRDSLELNGLLMNDGHDRIDVSEKTRSSVSALLEDVLDGEKYRFRTSLLWPEEREDIQKAWDMAGMEGRTGSGYLNFTHLNYLACLDWCSGVRGDTMLVSQPLAPLEDWLRDLIHVTGLRGSAARSYPMRPIGKEYRGVFQDTYAYVLWEWTHGHRKANTDRLDYFLEVMGLPEHARGHRVNDTSIEVCVSRSSGTGARRGDLVNVRDTGLGVAQALPWLVALVQADRQAVYIEEPEMHLHPEAQYNAAKVLVDAAMRGNTVIVETHSDILLLGIQEMVAKKVLPPECLSLNWFERDLQGASHVSVADVSPLGQLGDWPCDLRDVMRTARRSYIDFCVEHSADDGASE